MNRDRAIILKFLVVGLGAITVSCSSTQGVRSLTDSCTLWPDGPRSMPNKWTSGCAIHDKIYWEGGTRKERLAADRQLRSYIRETGHPIVAQVMYFGVRAFGPRFWGLSQKQKDQP